MSVCLVTMQAKKIKKKPKPEVKATQDVSSSVGKEPDEGLKLIWLTNSKAAAAPNIQTFRGTNGV